MPSPLAGLPIEPEEALPARHVRFDDLLAPAGSGDESTQGEGHSDQSSSSPTGSPGLIRRRPIASTPGTSTPGRRWYFRVDVLEARSSSSRPTSTSRRADDADGPVEHVGVAADWPRLRA